MVITNVNRVVYQGDGVTTSWPFTFRIIDATDVKLLLIRENGAEEPVTSDYYVDVVNSTVYYPGYAPGSEPPEADQPAKLQVGEKLEIYRRLPVTQEADLGEKWPFKVIEKGLDKLTMLMQDVYDWAGRNVINKNGNGSKWDAQNLPISNVGAPSNVTDAATKDYVDRILTGIILDGDARLVPVDNVAQLRAADLEAGQIAVTLGYHDINDGGAGVYSVRAAVPGETDDGGSKIILDNGAVAELITGKEGVNIRQFGCVGDGTTDDTDAFYAALDYADTVIVPEGTFLIDFKDIAITEKQIKGIRRNSSVLKQRNNGKPFLKVKTSCTIKDLKIDAHNNLTQTDILYFGYSDGVYETYRSSVIENVFFSADTNTVPLHFYIEADDPHAGTNRGGNWLGRLRDIYIYGCKTGVWFEYHPKIANALQWVTGFIAENIIIVNPDNYGFRWDSIDTPSGYKGMWSYGNYFANIQVDLFTVGSTGFYIGKGMGMLVSPVCFNDIEVPDPIPDGKTEDDYYGYSVEFAPTTSPSQYKFNTRIVGGCLEGLIKNKDYAQLNVLDKVSCSVRPHYGSSGETFEMLDAYKVNEVIPIDIFDPAFLNTCDFVNCRAEYCNDETGRYLKVTRISSGQYAFRVTIPQATLTAKKDIGKSTMLIAAGAEGRALNVLAACENALTMGNGNSYTSNNWRSTDKLYAKYLNFDNASFTDDARIYASVTDTSASAPTEIRVYDIKWLTGIVGPRFLAERINSTKLDVNAIKSYKTLSWTVSGSTLYMDLFLDDNMHGSSGTYPQPRAIKIFGGLPASTSGSSVSVGTIAGYLAKQSLVIPVRSYATGNEVGYLLVTYDGTVTYNCTTTHAALTTVTGSY